MQANSAIDYDAIAQQHGGAMAAVDYDALAAQSGGAKFSGLDAPKSAQSSPPESQSSSVMRFLKAAGKQLYSGTAGAGPQQSGTITQDFSQQQAQAKAGTLPSAWQTLKNSASDASPSNIDIGKTLSSFNPVDMQKFQSGDTAGGLGSTAANLLMLRKAFQQARGGAPEFNAPNTSEMVQPIGNYSKPSQQKLLPAAPIELGPSSITPQTQEGVLPAARKVFDDGRVQYLTRPLRPGESPDVYKNTNTTLQSYFIDKLREQMNAQTETETPVQTIERRMREAAASPYDRATAPKAPRATASVPVEAEQGGHAGGGVSSVEELSRPGTNYVVSPSGTLSYHGKAFAPESTPSGASHVTALPDGTLRVNAGPKLTAAQEMSLRKALPNQTPRVPTSEADMMDLLAQSLKKYGKKKSAAAGGDD